MRGKSLPRIAFGVIMTMAFLVVACAPAVQPSPTPLPPAPSPTKAPVATPTTGAPAPTPTIRSPFTPTPLPSPTPRVPPTATPGPRYGGILTVGTQYRLQTFDVQQNTSIANNGPVAPSYNLLVTRDPVDTRKVIPDLAQSWQVDSTGTVWTFKLASGVKWHDGRPFTADDVAYTFNRLRYPPPGVDTSGLQGQILYVKTVEAVDPITVKFTFDFPAAAFLNIISDGRYEIFPKHVFELTGGKTIEVVMGTGPQKFESFVRDSSYKARKNPDYFKKGLPYLNGVDFYILPDAATRLAAFRAGKTLITTWANGFQTTEHQILKQALGNKFVPGELPKTNYYTVSWNLKSKPWDDIRLRRAVFLAVDKQQEAKLTEGGGVGEPGLFANPDTWGLPMEELERIPGYAKPDRAEAKRLLAEAGFPNGLDVTVLMRTGQIYADHFAVFQDQVAQVGIRAKPNPQDTVQRAAIIREGRYEMGTNKGLYWDEPMLDFVGYTCAQNDAGYCNPQFDALYDKQNKTLDPIERKKVVLEMQRMLLQALPSYRSPWTKYLTGWWSHVKGFTTPVHVYYTLNYETVWLDQ